MGVGVFRSRGGYRLADRRGQERGLTVESGSESTDKDRMRCLG